MNDKQHHQWQCVTLSLGLFALAGFCCWIFNGPGSLWLLALLFLIWSE